MARGARARRDSGIPAADLDQPAGAILAASDVSFDDTIVLMLSGPGEPTFVGKAECLDSCKTRRLFLALGLTPVDRQAAGSAMADTATQESVRYAASSIRAARSASSPDMTLSVKLRPDTERHDEQQHLQSGRAHRIERGVLGVRRPERRA